MKNRLIIAPMLLGVALAAQEPGLPPVPPRQPAAQMTPTGPPQKEFEVVSIKPGDPSDRRVRMMVTPGHLSAQNISAKMLLQNAYGIRDHQISGAPGWMDSERYTIEAKFEGVPAQESLKAMMQSLLADRFQLKLRHETKEMPVYHLVVGKGGPKLKESEAPKGEGGPRQMTRMGRGTISGQSMQMSSLATSLSGATGRTVIDKTGLTGRYEVKLEWTPDESQGGPRELNPDAAAPVDSSGPTVFSALQEQLGLKLEAAKGPVEILVIESIQKPTGN